MKSLSSLLPLLAAGPAAARLYLPSTWSAEPVHRNLIARDVASTESTTAADNPSLEEWLAASKRAPTDGLTACPASCHDVRDDNKEAGWFLLSEASRLAACNETMLLDFIVENDADDEIPKAGIRACAADYSSSMKAAYEPDDQKAALCPTPNHAMVNSSVQMSHHASHGDVGFSSQDLLSAGTQVVNHFRSQKPSCVDNAIAFGYSRSAAIGVFAGAEVHQHGITTDILNNLLDFANANAVSSTVVAQLCQSDQRGADYAIGVVASAAGNLPFVHEAVKTWADGQCVASADGDQEWMTVTLRVPELSEPSSSAVNTLASTTPVAHLESRSRIVARAQCKTTTVKAGDGCWAVADRCGITQANLEKYNTRKDFCSTLVVDEKVCCSSGTLPSTIPAANSDGTCEARQVVSGDSCSSLASKCGLSAQDFTKVNSATDLCSSLKVGQHVCCSRGKLPDFKPKPNSDGSCHTYTTKTGDSCSAIAASNSLTVDDLESFNKKTWGWGGCKTLAVKFTMCLSTGTPPMPAAVSVSS